MLDRESFLQFLCRQWQRKGRAGLGVSAAPRHCNHGMPGRGSKTSASLIAADKDSRQGDGPSDGDGARVSVCNGDGAVNFPVDISDFLLRRCSWRNAPRCPDYVGPVEIRCTSNGCGRGLFTTQNVAAGSLLLISNAMAISYDDPGHVQLLSKLIKSARESPTVMHRLYTLASAPFQNHIAAPSMDFLSGKGLNVENIDKHLWIGSASGADSTSSDSLDEKRIMDAMMLNAFEGEFSSWPAKGPATRFSGLWLFPSFINHSCFRNASRLIIGEAMFVLAASDIQAGEEITISYVDVLAPLKQRQDACLDMRFGFVCNCKRCVFERSLVPLLSDISEQFHTLYDKAAEEVHLAVFSKEPLDLRSFPACMKLYETYGTLNGRLKGEQCASFTMLQRQWILAGYSAAFLGKWLVTGYATAFAAASFVNPMALELVEAMKATAPGMLRTLSFTTLLLFLAQKRDCNGDVACKLFQLGMDECLRVYGNQKLDILVKLMEQSSEVVPFF